MTRLTNLNKRLMRGLLNMKGKPFYYHFTRIDSDLSIGTTTNIRQNASLRVLSRSMLSCTSPTTYDDLVHSGHPGLL